MKSDVSEVEAIRKANPGLAMNARDFAMSIFGDKQELPKPTVKKVVKAPVIKKNSEPSDIRVATITKDEPKVTKVIKTVKKNTKPAKAKEKPSMESIKGGNGTFNYEVRDILAVLGTSKAGWNTELTLTSWNGAEAKYDIRSWSPDHQKMGKGCTFTKDEMMKLKEVLLEKF